MNERFTKKQKELLFLAEEYKKHPELFTQRTFIENSAVLADFGIQIPRKESFINGYLKLWPEDFLVEEVAEDGAVRTVSGSSVAEVTEGSPTIYATLVKSGLSTLEAVDELSRQLDLQRESIGFAGIKDKDAITAQRISLRNCPLEKLTTLQSPYLFLKDIEGGKGVMEKGRLRGNRFTIFIRTDVSLKDPVYFNRFAEELKRVKAEGFYNFFYLQRFGTPRLLNFQFAYHILRGDSKQAVFDFLTIPTERELPYFKRMREEFGKQFGHWRKIQEMLLPFPFIFAHERKIVDHLVVHPYDFTGAFKTIPDQVMIWLYALTSFFFNKKISEYLLRGEEPPKELPLFLSPDKADWEPYREMLEKYHLYPVPIQNLRPFPHIGIKSRRVPTKDRAKILNGELVDGGIVLEFDLSKGQYATTFLSHMFNLVSGFPPSDIRKERVDVKKIIGEPAVGKTVEKFNSVIRPKGENLFEQLAAES